MTDYTGSYMLNDIIRLLDRQQVLDVLGFEATQQMLISITQLATSDHGCNRGEILEGYAERFAICYCCLSITDDLVQRLCPNCR